MLLTVGLDSQFAGIGEIFIWCLTVRLLRLWWISWRFLEFSLPIIRGDHNLPDRCLPQNLYIQPCFIDSHDVFHHVCPGPAVCHQGESNLKYLFYAVALNGLNILSLDVCLTQAGIYWVTLIDRFVASWVLLFLALFEVIGVCYIYGMINGDGCVKRWGQGSTCVLLCVLGGNRFIKDIEMMLGEKSCTFWLWWRACWFFISPCIIAVSATECKTQITDSPVWEIWVTKDICDVLSKTTSIGSVLESPVDPTDQQTSSHQVPLGRIPACLTITLSC